MEKKLKEALIGYLNQISEIYSLYGQDSWSDEDFTTSAVIEWSSDIMEECVNDKNVEQVLKLIRKTISEGKRIMELPHDDDRESDGITTHDNLIEEAEKLKARIKNL